MNAHWRPSATDRRGGSPLQGNAPLFWTAAIVMTLAIVLGGATRFNETQAQIIELASLPLLGLALWRLGQTGISKGLKLPIGIILAVAVIPLVQIVPLPSGLWSRLPGHQTAAELRNLAGVQGGWLAISLNPRDTLAQALALIPPLAVFLATALLPLHRRRMLIVPLLVMVAVAILVGVGQIVGGQESTLYFYEHSNHDSALGFFANRNHQAALLVVATPLATLWLNIDRHQFRHSALPAAMALALLLTAMIALIVVKSRAGVFLLLPALAGSLALLWNNEHRESRKIVAIVGAVITLTLFVGVALGIGPVMERFSEGYEDFSFGGRVSTAIATWRAAIDFLPFGSGVGTFVQVYTGYEDVDIIGPAFWNHAHNDYVESFLETGLLGLLAGLAFAYWWLRRTFEAWTGPSSPAATLTRAASLVTGLLLLHSTVDYPLRTLALSVVFAFACGLMVDLEADKKRSRAPSRAPT